MLLTRATLKTEQAPLPQQAASWSLSPMQSIPWSLPQANSEAMALCAIARSRLTAHGSRLTAHGSRLTLYFNKKTACQVPDTNVPCYYGDKPPACPFSSFGGQNRPGVGPFTPLVPTFALSVTTSGLRLTTFDPLVTTSTLSVPAFRPSVATSGLKNIHIQELFPKREVPSGQFWESLTGEKYGSLH